MEPPEALLQTAADTQLSPARELSPRHQLAPEPQGTLAPWLAPTGQPEGQQAGASLVNDQPDCTPASELVASGAPLSQADTLAAGIGSYCLVEMAHRKTAVMEWVPAMITVCCSDTAVVVLNGDDAFVETIHLGQTDWKGTDQVSAARQYALARSERIKRMQELKVVTVDELHNSHGEPHVVTGQTRLVEFDITVDGGLTYRHMVLDAESSDGRYVVAWDDVAGLASADHMDLTPDSTTRCVPKGETFSITFMRDLCFEKAYGVHRQMTKVAARNEVVMQAGGQCTIWLDNTDDTQSAVRATWRTHTPIDRAKPKVFKHNSQRKRGETTFATIVHNMAVAPHYASDMAPPSMKQLRTDHAYDTGRMSFVFYLQANAHTYFAPVRPVETMPVSALLATRAFQQGGWRQRRQQEALDMMKREFGFDDPTATNGSTSPLFQSVEFLDPEKLRRAIQSCWTTLCNAQAAEQNGVRRATTNLESIVATTRIPEVEHGTKHIGSKMNAHIGRKTELKRYGPSRDIAAAMLLAAGRKSEIPEVRVFEPSQTGPDNTFLRKHPSKATPWVALAWLHDLLLQQERPEVWARMMCTWGDLDLEEPAADSLGRPYRLFNGTCFAAMAMVRVYPCRTLPPPLSSHSSPSSHPLPLLSLPSAQCFTQNRDIGTCWHVDDDDVPWGQTMVTIVAWGMFRRGAFNMLANGSMTTVDVACDSR